MFVSNFLSSKLYMECIGMPINSSFVWETCQGSIKNLVQFQKWCDIYFLLFGEGKVEKLTFTNFWLVSKRRICSSNAPSKTPSLPHYNYGSFGIFIDFFGVSKNLFWVSLTEGQSKLLASKICFHFTLLTLVLHLAWVSNHSIDIKTAVRIFFHKTVITTTLKLKSVHSWCSLISWKIWNI